MRADGHRVPAGADGGTHGPAQILDISIVGASGDDAAQDVATAHPRILCA